ncbi:hypothetical protein ANOM_009107 [Aspergillus nomiae NRRL 13137]|uniref:Cyclin-D1-binding protein 1-like N-terminal domain-containing protein n=1 Tax=Aspergillus nomiae NRRL (strain ATCC 15546 / NRRL 13137 / CBS 260.88 / M93) TaxID=1509407 RepID=A0A0L1ISB5_ASPN3|nr:uncharacterized protein ANOM_009107 [Aspergillus nomiae NRRL 13137]KNG82446.1 hypothetical protein ANOM_009107 [Aspergillus nomiae NRRL 13137]
MSPKLHVTLTTTLTLVEQFHLTLSSPSGDSTSAELSSRDALPLLSASSTALKSQVTKLSLLAVTSPFTPSAVGSILSNLNESVLPSFVTAALLITPTDHTKAFQAEALSLTKTGLNELSSLVKEVQSIAERNDEVQDRMKKKGIELSQSEKDLVTVATGRVWGACDALIDLASNGVVGFVIRRVEEWRDLVRDAVEEIDEWDPDEEGDEFFDELLSDDGKQSIGKGTAIRLLKPVVQIYPAIITNRLKKVPEFLPSLVNRLESLMTNLHRIPEQVDEVAGALYEADLERSIQYLERTKDCAVEAVKLVVLPWTEQSVANSQQKAEDRFTDWSKTWLKVIDGVSKPLDDFKEAKSQ